eukprot:5832724-Pyramimonas_sp.AAC.1
MSLCQSPPSGPRACPSSCRRTSLRHSHSHSHSHSTLARLVKGRLTAEAELTGFHASQAQMIPKVCVSLAIARGGAQVSQAGPAHAHWVCRPGVSGVSLWCTARVCRSGVPLGCVSWLRHSGVSPRCAAIPSLPLLLTPPQCGSMMSSRVCRSDVSLGCAIPG